MSDDRAIAVVTAALRDVLDGVAAGAVDGAGVRTLRPGNAQLDQDPCVNLFLYRVSPNPAWRNQPLATLGPGDVRLVRPVAAYDLEYLFSFHGDSERQEPERLMGAVARAMTSRPYLERAQIRRAVEQVDRPWLAGADLDQQVEPVRFAPIQWTIEELGRLWSMLVHAPYVPSMAWQASVVLIDATEPRPEPMPVRSVALHAVRADRPFVTHVEPAAWTPGAALAVFGGGFTGDAVTVRLGDRFVVPAEVAADRLSVTVPADLRGDSMTLRVLTTAGVTEGFVAPRSRP